MTGTTAQGNRTLTALAVVLAVFCAIGTAAVASQVWTEIVVIAQDAITHD